MNNTSKLLRIKCVTIAKDKMLSLCGLSNTNLCDHILCNDINRCKFDVDTKDSNKIKLNYKENTQTFAFLAPVLGKHEKIM